VARRRVVDRLAHRPRIEPPLPSCPAHEFSEDLLGRHFGVPGVFTNKIYKMGVNYNK
jgi:hypothetical protein